MKMIVGLGNPGKNYEGTRHNVGFDVGFELAKRWQAERPREKFEAALAEGTLGNERVLLVWPQTYMNLSGRSVAQILKFYKIQPADVLVVCDDMNLKLGQLRLRGSGSAGGQKGLLSILQCLATEDVPRLRLGVDRPPPGQDVAQYVLARFRTAEWPVVDEMIRKGADGAEQWVRQGLELAMNMVNAGSPQDGSVSASPRPKKSQDKGSGKAPSEDGPGSM